MGLGTIQIIPGKPGATSPSLILDQQATPDVYAEPQPSVYQPPPSRSTSERVPLGVVILDKLFNGTVGSLSLDIKRPKPPSDDVSMSTLFTVRAAPQRQRRRPRGYNDPTIIRSNDPPPLLPSLAFEHSGARVKVMRHFQFGPQFEFVKYGLNIRQPTWDVGFGGAFEFDVANLQPQARLKFKDFLSFKFLPRPAVKFQKRVELGTSGYGVRLSFECPLENIDRFWLPPSRLMVNLDNTMDNGIRVSQSGLEFSSNRWLLGDSVRLRALGVLSLPHELPVEEGEQWVHFDVKRLGIKARW